MDLKRRLARLEPKSAATAGAPDSAATDRRLPADLGFSEIDGAGGRIWIRQRELGRKAWPLSLDWETLNGLFTRTTRTPLRGDQILLLDAETTGLAGGTGTLAFLVGTVWRPAKGAAVLRQYFLPSPGAEAAMLADLSDLAKRFAAIMTYNGNSFDLPLLRTRGILSRIRDLLHDPISWDLLPASRRLWGRRLLNCRQQTVEEMLCGRPRGAGDIDGHLIPQVWLDFVHSGRIRGLREIVTHNDRDMVGMVEIFRAVVERLRVYRDPEAPTGRMPWPDAWSLALIAERQRDATRQQRWIAEAISGRLHAAALDLPDEVDQRFWKDALRLIKRTRVDAETGRVLAAARAALGDRPWLDREAAIYHEHRLGDPCTALAYAERLGDAHRIERLNARLDERRGRRS